MCFLDQSEEGLKTSANQHGKRAIGVRVIEVLQ